MPNCSGSLGEGHLNPPWNFREGFFIDITAENKSSKSHSNQLGIVVIGWLWWEWEGGTRAFQADWQNEKSHMHEKKPIVWVTFISCRCESSTWEAGKGGWMLQQRYDTLSQRGHAEPLSGFFVSELFLAAGRQVASGVRSAGREPGWVAGNTGYLGNDEKLYEDSDNMKKRVWGWKVFRNKMGRVSNGWLDWGWGALRKKEATRKMPGSIWFSFKRNDSNSMVGEWLKAHSRGKSAEKLPGASVYKEH